MYHLLGACCCLILLSHEWLLGSGISYSQWAYRITVDRACFPVEFYHLIVFVENPIDGEKFGNTL